jgi:hypothetical protein
MRSQGNMMKNKTHHHTTFSNFFGVWDHGSKTFHGNFSSILSTIFFDAIHHDVHLHICHNYI